MSEKIDKNIFRSIDGGKKDESELTKEERISEINEGVENQDKLTREEKIDLVKNIHKEKILEIKENVFNFSGRILSDDEASFIKGCFVGLASGDERIMNELREKFPDLNDYFDEVLKRMENYKKESAE